MELPPKFILIEENIVKAFLLKEIRENDLQKPNLISGVSHTQEMIGT